MYDEYGVGGAASRHEASIISSLKSDALVLVEGDDDTLLPCDRDLPEVGDILDLVTDLLGLFKHQRLSEFQLKSGMYQQPCFSLSDYQFN